MTAQPDNVLPFAGSDRPTASVVFVSPEMAQRWLDEYNVRNRHIRPATVRKYARDMADGRWQLSGEGIKFGTNGKMLDGQHRLSAIVASGQTVPMFIMRGIDPSAQRVMDTGRARTASDALAMKGDRHTATLAAAARLALGIESGMPNPGSYEATHGEIEAWVEANPDIHEACQVASAVARRTDCPPAVVAYSYWRMAKISRQDAASFWVAAADKVGLSYGDPVVAMTNRFAEARRNREQLGKRAYLSVIFRCWNYRRNGKTMRLAKVNSPAGGLIPIPELR